VLAEKDVDILEIEDIGNKWILPRGMNRNKSAKHPKEFLRDVSQSILKTANIDLKDLDYRTFAKFIRERREALVARAQQLTRLTPADFDVLRQYEEEEQAAE
jgi:hypothetical protein